MTTASIGDARDLAGMERRMTADLDTRFAAFQLSMLAFQTSIVARMKTQEDAMTAAIAALALRKQAFDLGVLPITVGSLVAVTTAGMTRRVLAFAGVKPTDILWAVPDEYLPEGYGLPQAMCRNAGQLEIRLTVPAIALGTTKTINLAITALR